MRLIKITVTLTRDRLIFNRGLAYNSRKRAHSSELNLKSDGRNGYTMRLFGGLVDRIMAEERDGYNAQISFSVWCREAQANEWELKLMDKLRQEIATRLNDLSHLMFALNK